MKGLEKYEGKNGHYISSRYGIPHASTDRSPLKGFQVEWRAIWGGERLSKDKKPFQVYSTAFYGHNFQ